MADERWSTGKDHKTDRMIFRDGVCVGMLSDRDLAKEVVNVLNGAAPNDREFIVQALSTEANRIFNKQEKDYPSNILDIVSNNLREGKSTELTVPPDWMKRQFANNQKK